MKISRRTFVASASLTALLGRRAEARFPHGSVSLPSAQTLKIGAGGQLTGISIANDGTKVVRTDTYGGYKWNNSTSQWDQLVTKISMPLADQDLYLHQGIYSIAIAPSDSTIIYMYWNGYVYKSVDGGATWVKTTWTTQITGGPNSSEKLSGPYMAVDPQNPLIVYAGTPSGSLFVTFNGGTSWAAVAGLATPSLAANEGGGYLIVFDPSSSVASTKKQGIYVSVYGTGVYHSTDGGGSFTLTTSGPTTHRHMNVAPDGVAFVTDNSASSTNIWRFNSPTWTHTTGAISGGTGHSIAIDPSAAANIYVGGDGAPVAATSSDHGVTWITHSAVGGTNASRVATDVPWLADSTTLEKFLTNGNVVADPSTPGTFWFAEGIGVWKIVSPPLTDTFFSITSQSAGIEQLVGQTVVAPPGGKPIVLCQDRPLFYSADVNTYPSHYEPRYNSTQSIVHGWDADWASTSPSTLVAVMNNGLDYSGISSDGGLNWTAFGGKPAVVSGGGAIAAASATNFVWLQNNNGDPYYSIDGGATWNVIAVTGVPPGRFTGNLTSGSNIITNLSINTSRLAVGATVQNPNGNFPTSTITSIDSATQIHISNTATANVTADGVSMESGWGFSAFAYNRNVCADRVDADTFYMYNYGLASFASAVGVYKTINKGVSWTRVYSAGLATAAGSASGSGGPVVFRAVPGPGNAGHLFFCSGGNDVIGGHPVAVDFLRSTDHGATWAAVSGGFAEVSSYGFGPIAPGQSYPSIIVVGYKGTTYGVWYSKDNAATWTQIGDFPNGTLDFVRGMDVDKNTLGVAYLAYGGSGFKVVRG